MVFPIIFILIAIIVVVGICSGFRRARTLGDRMLSVAMPASFAPGSYGDRGMSDGTDFRTVRIPEKCPSCGAPLAQENIDWVGPLEAKCNYCGATIRATFERI